MLYVVKEVIPLFFVLLLQCHIRRRLWDYVSFLCCTTTETSSFHLSNHHEIIKMPFNTATWHYMSYVDLFVSVELQMMLFFLLVIVHLSWLIASYYASCLEIKFMHFVMRFEVVTIDERKNNVCLRERVIKGP